MMGRSALRLGLGGFSGIVTAWLAAASACASEGYALSRGQYWLTDWAARPVVSLVADVDGDGRADLVAFDPRGDASLWVNRTSILGKPTPQVAARERFGREGLAAIAGRFTRGAGEDVLAVFADGSVRIAWGTRRGEAAYARDDLAATIAPGMRPRPPIRLVAGEFDGDGMVDAVIVDDSGRLLLLRNETAGASSPKFRCEEIEGTLPPKVAQGSRRPLCRRRSGRACLEGRREHRLSGRPDVLDWPTPPPRPGNPAPDRGASRSGHGRPVSRRGDLRPDHRPSIYFPGATRRVPSRWRPSQRPRRRAATATGSSATSTATAATTCSVSESQARRSPAGSPPSPLGGQVTIRDGPTRSSHTIR